MVPMKAGAEATGSSLGRPDRTRGGFTPAGQAAAAAPPGCYPRQGGRGDRAPVVAPPLLVSLRFATLAGLSTHGTV